MRAQAYLETGRAAAKHVDAVVLSGGGSRGAYQAGVLLAFEEAGYAPGRFVGTSIGAFHGAAAAGGLPMADVVAMWRRVRTRDVLMPRLLAPTRTRRGPAGILDALDWDRIRHGIPLQVTAIDAEGRRPVVWDNASLDTLRLQASAALPPVFAAVEVDGVGYIDGGLWQNPPIAPALDAPLDRLVIVCHEPVTSHRERSARGLRALTLTLSDIVWHARAQETLSNLEARRALPRRHPLRVSVKEVHIVAPRRSLVPDILRFDPAEAAIALQAGHDDGRAWLGRP